MLAIPVAMINWLPKIQRIYPDINHSWPGPSFVSNGLPPLQLLPPPPPISLHVSALLATLHYATSVTLLSAGPAIFSPHCPALNSPAIFPSLAALNWLSCCYWSAWQTTSWGNCWPHQVFFPRLCQPPLQIICGLIQITCRLLMRLYFCLLYCTVFTLLVTSKNVRQLRSTLLAITRLVNVAAIINRWKVIFFNTVVTFNGHYIR